uniref:GDP-fucose protein O-fucosyltransferase 1 n=1 Tax=Hirondellea gigas TaxID=1518452 RepID=A0A2P2I998_9CRUS
MSTRVLILWSFLLAGSVITAVPETDRNGYILYCPCMGRFGNQADHFLGVLAFARALNRTLVLPPWVEYKHGNPRSVQVPFATYFQVSAVSEYHRVLTMEQFMQHLAPTVWPHGNRTVLCYMARHNSEGCNAKEGNPFGPFWDTFDVEFSDSSFYRPLSYDVHQRATTQEWGRQYNAQHWPVLAFTGAPASFPVQGENRPLQEFLQWSGHISDKVDALIKTFPRGPFVGIHLRNGVDWKRACDHVEQSPNLFAAPQCLGYRNEHGRANLEMCLPSDATIVKQLKRVLRSTGANTVFVASDSDHMIQRLQPALDIMNVTVLHSNNAGPHVDLAVLARSNHFIANCISSFSAFVKRERDVHGLPSSFWAFPIVKRTYSDNNAQSIKHNMHDEL